MPFQRLPRIEMRAFAKTIVGFDSAWVDHPKKPGAICSLQIRDDGRVGLIRPQLASFSSALAFIQQACANSDQCLAAIDQPTIVPNVKGCRPVDRVAGSLISWLGGGVQPANRSKLGMFDDGAPIWSFKERLGAIENPERTRLSNHGLFLIEVFPALALPTLEGAFLGRKLGPRYNPDRRKTFKQEHWRGILAAVARLALIEEFIGFEAWIEESSELAQPRKTDQDKLDAVLCALIGYYWLLKPRSDSIMIGDLGSGYMIAPASKDVRSRLTSAAMARGIPIDGTVLAASAS